MIFSDDMTLGEARDALRALLMPEGVYTNKRHPCPCCKREVQIYKRNIHAGMARGLIAAYRHGAAADYVHAPELVDDYQNTDFARLRLWALVGALAGRRDDGGPPGFYRLTELGVSFVKGEMTVPKYVLVYAGRVLGRSEKQISIYDALGTKFNYDELMAGI